MHGKETDGIQYAIEQLTGVVTLNRPETKNAITTEMWKALPAVLQALKNSGARVIVLTGTGKVFASGADLSELSALQGSEEAKEFWTAIEECLKKIWRFDLPVIAMINGACVGGGCLLATACDLRYAARCATFSIPVARLGIVLDDESIKRLVSIVGDSFARQLLFSAMSVDSDEAERCGLVNKTFADCQLKGEVMRIADSISSNDGSSVSAAKRSLTRIREAVSINADDETAAIIESYLNPQLRARVKGVLRNLPGHQNGGRS